MSWRKVFEVLAGKTEGVVGTLVIFLLVLCGSVAPHGSAFWVMATLFDGITVWLDFY